MEKAVGIKHNEKLKEIYSKRLPQGKTSIGYRITCKIDTIEEFDYVPSGTENSEQIVLVTTDTINKINTGCNMDMKGKTKRITFPGVDNLVITPSASVKIVAKHVGGESGVNVVINM